LRSDYTLIGKQPALALLSSTSLHESSLNLIRHWPSLDINANRNGDEESKARASPEGFFRRFVRHSLWKRIVVPQQASSDEGK